MTRIWLTLAVFLGLAAQSAPALADIQYKLTCNTAACTGAGAGTYGTVTLSTPGAAGTIHVDVTLASGFRFGGNGTQSLVWNGLTEDTLVVSNVSGGFGSNGNNANSSYAASPFSASGNFDYVITRSNSNLQTSLTFDVTKSGGLTLGNFATGNDGGAFYFASLIRTTSDGTTFYVASNTAGVRVPEPSSLTLSIAGLAGLAGLAMMQRRRKMVRA